LFSAGIFTVTADTATNVGFTECFILTAIIAEYILSFEL